MRQSFAAAVFALTIGLCVPPAGAAEADNAGFVAGMPNRVLLQFETESFDKDFTPWSTWTVEYSRKLSRATLIGRVNQTHRFGDKDDTQIEFDAYPKLWKKAYAYLNVGRAGSGRYNGAVLYPDWRYGAELFQGLPKGFEISAGARYLDFPSTKVTLWTGSLGYYWKDWWFAGRPYYARSRDHSVVPTRTSHSSSGYFTARWYFGKPPEYLEVLAGKGSGVDAGSVLEPSRLDAWTLESDVRKLLGSRCLLRAGVGFRARDIGAGGTRYSGFARIGLDVFF